MSSNYFIFQGGPETQWLIEEQYWSEIFWTASKSVQKGDIVFIYLTAPISKIVGSARIVGEPFFNHGQASMFSNDFMKDKWCVEIGSLLYFGQHEELSMKALREAFSVDWGWVRYPRGMTRIPDKIVTPFLEMVAPFLPDITVAIEVPEVK